jgi:hypothetical protein
MIPSLLLALSAPALADTLPVDLGDKTASITIPRGAEATVTLKPIGEGDAVRWTNTSSAAISVVCSAEGKMAEDDFVEQVLLQVGDKKWALAPGSSVKMKCSGAPATVNDIHGETIGTFAGGVLVTIEGLRK